MTVRQAPARSRPPPGRTANCASKGGGLAVCVAARSESRAAADTRATLRSRPSSPGTGRTPAFVTSLPRCDAAAAARPGDPLALLNRTGADGRDLNPVLSLEGPCSATELHPHGVRAVADAAQVKRIFSGTGRGMTPCVDRHAWADRRMRVGLHIGAMRGIETGKGVDRATMHQGTGKWEQPRQMAASPL